MTATYLINRSPCVPLNGKILEAEWSSKEVSLSHLRVFGCAALIHQKYDKLSPRSAKCVFLGYPEGLKGYRLWLKGEHGFKIAIVGMSFFTNLNFHAFLPQFL